MQWRNLLIYFGFFGFVILVLAEQAVAGSSPGMPWEDPLNTIMNSITGPVAMVISLLGITVAGGMLVFGGELGEFTRRIIMLVLVLGLLVSAASILTLLYSGAGAMV